MKKIERFWKRRSPANRESIEGKKEYLEYAALWGLLEEVEELTRSDSNLGFFHKKVLEIVERRHNFGSGVAPSFFYKHTLFQGEVPGGRMYNILPEKFDSWTSFYMFINNRYNWDLTSGVYFKQKSVRKLEEHFDSFYALDIDPK